MGVIAKLVAEYYKSIARDKWQNARIMDLNRSGFRANCPYCSSDKSEFVLRWQVDDHYGLFENNEANLETIYLTRSGIKRLIPAMTLMTARHNVLSVLKNLAYIDYRRCQECDLIFQNYPHTAESAAKYYRKYYRMLWESGSENALVYGRDDDRWVYQQTAIAKHFLRATRLAPGARTLDLGCGEGWVCKWLQENGYEAHGIEPSISMANYGIKVLGCGGIKAARYDENSYEPDYFDGIVSHHVIEHTVDVRGVFRAIHRHLKPEGYLLLQVPCVDTATNEEELAAHLQGGHVYGFSEKFLRYVLVEQGLSIIEIRKTPMNLNSLDVEQIDKWGITAWADDPGGITILAQKDASHS